MSFLELGLRNRLSCWVLVLKKELDSESIDFFIISKNYDFINLLSGGYVKI